MYASFPYFQIRAGTGHSPCQVPVIIGLDEADIIIALIQILHLAGYDITPVRCGADRIAVCGSLSAKGLGPHLFTADIGF